MKSKKPVIGVTPLWDGAKSSIWMIPGYMDMVRESGGVPIILPLRGESGDILQVCDMCDGFLLTGGDDVDPALYGHPQRERCGEPNVERDCLEREVFEYATRRDAPVLGICRGIQLMNVLMGGTLYQDLPSEHIHPHPESHQMTPPYDREWHRVKVLRNTPLYDIVGVDELGVNSYHHQAIDRLSEGLEAMAYSADGLVEALYMPTRRFVCGVQWHPELNFQSEESSRKLMRKFLSECSK